MSDSNNPKGTIYAIGETVLDIIFMEDKPRDAGPGGAMLNSSVSLGRMGAPVEFISEYGQDQVGDLIDRFLRQNGVGTRYIYRFREGATALAMAMLDEENNAHYTFYKHYPRQRLESLPESLTSEDYLLFGSIFAISPEVRHAIDKMVFLAGRSGSLIFYDPNFRKPHLDKLKEYRPVIEENIGYADILRASHEDLEIIFNIKDPGEAWKLLKSKVSVLVYTRGNNSVSLRTGQISHTWPTRGIDPVSTIGAGDNFNAGMLYALYMMGVHKADLESLRLKDWDKIIQTGIEFATLVCLSYENYVPEGFTISI